MYIRRLFITLSLSLVAASSLQAMRYYQPRNNFHWFGHPLNQPQQNQPLHARSLADVKRWFNSPTKIAMWSLLGCHLRMFSKSYDKQHMSISESTTLKNIIDKPLKCFDDGFIGHPGFGNEVAAYGALGITWRWFYRINNTLVSVDQAQRALAAWYDWLNRIFGT